MNNKSRILSLINFTIINNIYIPLFNLTDKTFKVWDDGNYIDVEGENIDKKYFHDVYYDEKKILLTEMKKNNLDNVHKDFDLLWNKFLEYKGENKLEWWKNLLRIIYESDFSGSEKFEFEKYVLHNIKLQEYSSSFKIRSHSEALYGHSHYSNEQYFRLLRLVTLPLILIVLSKRNEIPPKKNKNSQGLKNSLIRDKLYSKYKLFNSNLFDVNRNSVESYLSIFYNQDYKIEKHKKFKNAFDTYNTLEDNEIEAIYQYILTSDQHSL